MVGIPAVGDQIVNPGVEVVQNEVLVVVELNVMVVEPGANPVAEEQ